MRSTANWTIVTRPLRVILFSGGMTLTSLRWRVIYTPRARGFHRIPFYSQLHHQRQCQISRHGDTSGSGARCIVSSADTASCFCPTTITWHNSREQCYAREDTQGEPYTVAYLFQRYRFPQVRIQSSNLFALLTSSLPVMRLTCC